MIFYNTIKALLPVSRIKMPSGYVAFEISVTGGMGGDSLRDATKGRANAIKVLANLLLVAIRQMNIKLYLVNISGGNEMPNSIPQEAMAKIALPVGDINLMETLVGQCNDALQNQYSMTDPAVSVFATTAVWNSTVMSEESTHVLLAAINGIPTDVVNGGQGIVNTVNNIAQVESRRMDTLITTHSHGYDEQMLDSLTNNISHILTLVGAELNQFGGKM